VVFGVLLSPARSLGSIARCGPEQVCRGREADRIGCVETEKRCDTVLGMLANELGRINKYGCQLFFDMPKSALRQEHLSQDGFEGVHSSDKDT